jgi:alpha-L-fucosidase
MGPAPPPDRNRFHGRDQRWWDGCRFGLLIHASAASVPAWAPIGQYAEWYRAHIDPTVRDTLLHPSPMIESLAHHADRWAHVDHYDNFASLLHFDDFDPDAWTELALAAGMSYSVMVAKHHDGLCWWDAPGTEFSVVNTGPRRNVLGEYAAACERAALTFGTYYSLLDWHDPRYPTCEYVEQVVHPHVLDLVDRYGSRMLWGDGHWGGGGTHWRSDELIAAARRIEPSLIVNDRWWSDGPGVKSFEYRLPGEIVHLPWEMRRGIGPSFGYNRAEAEQHLLDAHGVVALLTEVVAKGGHLLLAIGPDSSGRLPELHTAPLRSAGEWVRRHAALVNRSTPWSQWGDASVRYLQLDGQLHAVDVAGSGRFPALERRIGRVTGVSLIADVGDQPQEFTHSDDGLVVHRRRFAGRDPLGVAVYRIDVEPPPEPPIELFPAGRDEPVELASILVDAQPGQIVQLGDATYVGPARVPEGVVVRGLGPGRTVIDGLEGLAVSVAARGRVEHCAIRGGGSRIVWLPKVAVVLAGTGANLLGCEIEGHVEFAAADCRVTSCTLTGAIASAVDRVTVSRSTMSGMNWDCAVDIAGGTGHLIESCRIDQVLEAVRLGRTTGATVRGNTISARWWGVRAVDSEGTQVVGNTVTRTTRAVDVDGGTQAVVTGNAVADGDSGCIVQRGASDTEIAGNRWERTRIGILAWDAGPLRHHDNAAVDLLDPDHTVAIGP